MDISTLESGTLDQDIAIHCEAQPDAVREAARQASGKLAPLWPLSHFVAVNPFLGLTDHRFIEAAASMALVADAHLTMPRSFYAEAMANGRITDADLRAALDRAEPSPNLPRDVTALKSALHNHSETASAPLATVADVATTTTRVDWAALATDRLSVWAAGYFDKGQAAWPAASLGMTPYQAWRDEALVDRTPQVMGLSGFCEIVKSLPESADAMLIEGVMRLGLETRNLATYFHRLLMTVSGWAGHARYRVWQSELRGHADDTSLLELLAIRLAWDVAILDALRNNENVVAAWDRARAQLAKPVDDTHALVVDVLLQSAYENASQRELIAAMRNPPSTARVQRDTFQVAFCIDVRSEVFRRALEGACAEIATIGVAGFFGMPVEPLSLGDTHGSAQCPVLLAPAFTLVQGVKCASASEQQRIATLRRLRERTASAWYAFRTAAVSSFAFVESMGWTYAWKLLVDGLGFPRTRTGTSAQQPSPHVSQRLYPVLDTGSLAGRGTGIAAKERVDLAEGILKAMSLKSGFARLVMLAGHGATSVNNPYASGLHCGACGGHSGEVNARVATAILNETPVRKQLAARGMRIPADTWFLAGLHNTTTDAVTVFDEEEVPASHAADLAQLKICLHAAAAHARIERASKLKLNPRKPVDAQVFARSRDWSQVRPEWGLAGCAAYIVAPRTRTAGLDLGGRAFLNSYDWRIDEGFAILESIMTAPMVVASWINLQYYAATVDNRVFGSGNKVLHNVVGRLGVLEGHAGDLRSGLPWQSVHDGERLIHEPLRLSVLIAAPPEAINQIIARHESVRQLVDNGWIHLFAMVDSEMPIKRYRGACRWEDAA